MTAKPYVIVGISIGNTARILMIFFIRGGMFVKFSAYASRKARKVVISALKRDTFRLLKSATKTFLFESTV